MKKGNTIKAFTLVEILVAVAIFSLVVGTAIGIFVMVIRNQKQVLISQQLLDQTSYALEYMSRALRMAKKERSDPPGCLSQKGLNYEIISNRIKFIDYQDNCTEYYLEAGQLKKRIGANSWELTSPKIEVNQFMIKLSGEGQDDNIQPRVTISLNIQGKNLASPPKLKIQTTISQRNLDVKN